MARVLVRRGTWVARSRLVQRRRTLDSIESGWARQIATTALKGEVVGSRTSRANGTSSDGNRPTASLSTPLIASPCQQSCQTESHENGTPFE